MTIWLEKKKHRRRHDTFYPLAPEAVPDAIGSFVGTIPLNGNKLAMLQAKGPLSQHVFHAPAAKVSSRSVARDHTCAARVRGALELLAWVAFM